MTEVPDYLLRRSQERRAALGLAPKGDGAEESTGAAGPAPSSASGAEVAAPSSPAPAPAESAGAPVPATAATAQLPSYIAPGTPRSGVPVWMMPVLVILPLWAIVYLGAFGARSGTAADGPPSGPAVYAKAGCGGCHGAQGEGGVGPALAGGESKLTFPNEADHVAWVETGSASSKGKPYGDPARAGGPRIATSGGMQGFTGTLTPEEIQAVVAYERDEL